MWNKTRNDPVPLHCATAPTRIDERARNGKGYRYAHDYDAGVVAQKNLAENGRTSLL